MVNIIILFHSSILMCTCFIGDVGQKSVYKVFSVLSGFLTDTELVKLLCVYHELCW